MSAKSRVVHLDTAGASRVSTDVLRAMVEHLELEAAVGGYEAETIASAAIQQLRADLGALVGISADDIALTASASDAFTALLRGVVLRRGARVGRLRGAYESNRLALEARAPRDELDLVDLAVDGEHRLDLDALQAELERGLDLVYVDHIASQRGVVQAAGEIVAMCHAAGVPVVLDVAQAAGQLDLSDVGADAYVGTSRKWLRGPRGAGFAAVRPAGLLAFEPPLEHALTWRWIDGGWVTPESAAARLERGETSVAARVGFAIAVRELLAEGVATRRERIAALATRLRTAAVDSGWQVGEPVDERCGIVTMRPPDGAVEAAHASLRAAGIQTGLVPASRAADLDGPWLRVSAGHDTPDRDLDTLLTELA